MLALQTIICLLLLPALGCDRGGDSRQAVQEPPAYQEGLAANSAARMSTKLERTILGIDVLRVDLRFGPETASHLEELATRDPDDEDARAALTDSIARTALQSRNVLIEVEMLRDVPLDRYLEETVANLRRAAEAGYLPRDVFETTSDRLRPWFSFLEGRDLVEGDRLAYRVRGDTVRTLYWGADGYRFLDQTDPLASDQRLAVLGGYLAEGVELREGLLESLFDSVD